MVVPLVAVSGPECVEALLLADFRIEGRSEAGTSLGKGLRVVVVPDAELLTPEELSAILRSAGVPYTEFLDYLSEIPTEPALDRHTGARRNAALSSVPPSEDAAAS